MVSAVTINNKVNYGFAKAAAALGFPYSWYRPGTVPGIPIQDGNLLGTVTAYITTDASLKSTVPPENNKPIWFGAYDTTLTQPGDYLVGQQGTYFIATEFLPSPPSLVYCNANLTVQRDGGSTPSPQARFGSLLNPTILAQDFPGWLMSAERRTTPELAMPGDVPLPSANIMLPVSVTSEILRGDIILDIGTTTQTYNVQSADLLFAAWNIVALQSGG
jgi:hypothetical protein